MLFPYKKVFIKKFVYLPTLKILETLPETRLFFSFGLMINQGPYTAQRWDLLFYNHT